MSGTDYSIVFALCSVVLALGAAGYTAAYLRARRDLRAAREQARRQRMQATRDAAALIDRLPWPLDPVGAWPDHAVLSATFSHSGEHEDAVYWPSERDRDDWSRKAPPPLTVVKGDAA